MTPFSTIVLAILAWFLIGAIVVGLIIGTGITCVIANRKPKPRPYPTIEWDDCCERGRR